MKKFLLPLLLFILIIPTFISLLRPGFFPMQDDLQAFRIFEMDKCFQDFQIPCRWVPDMGYRFGYPQFEYYGPSTYYLGEIIHLLGFQFIDSTKVLFILGYIAGAFGMYLLLNELVGRYPALVGALLYTYAPYKADEVYVRGDMDEFWALALMPFIFWALLKLVKLKSWRWVGVSGVFVGLLLITHNLMSMLFFPIAGVWVLLLIILEKDWRLLYKVIPAFLLGIGLAGFFTLPVLTEQKDAHLETLVGGYFGFEQHFIDLKELFLSNFWGYGSSVLGPNDDLSLSTGVIQWLGGGLAVFLGALSFKKFKKISIIVLVLGLVELVVLFMMHQRSLPIWYKIPPLIFLQFPWRFLGISTFLLSFFGGIGVYLLSKLEFKFLSKNSGFIYGGVLILATIILNIYFFRPVSWLNITDADKFSGSLWQKELTISIFDYLPIYAKLPPIHEAPAVPEILDGGGQFLSYQKGSDFQKGQVEITKGAELRLPLFDFPGMKVWVDGKEISHGNSDCRNEPFCMGLINFRVSPGNHDIEVRLTNTPIRTVGNSLTILSLVLVLGLIIPWRFKKR